MEFWFGFAFDFSSLFVCLGVVRFFFYKVLSCCFFLFHGRFFYKEGKESKEMNERCL